MHIRTSTRNFGAQQIGAAAHALSHRRLQGRQGVEIGCSCIAGMEICLDIPTSTTPRKLQPMVDAIWTAFLTSDQAARM